MRFVVVFILMFAVAVLPARAEDVLPALIQVLRDSDDPQFQLDILTGINEGLKGKRGLKTPAGWESLATKLSQSPNADVRELTRKLSLTFGSASALEALRAELADRGADLKARTNALAALLESKDPQLPETLQKILQEPSLRGAALRGLAAYDHPHTASAILRIYPELGPIQRKDALNTLASRTSFAKALLAAVSANKISARDLTAETFRQLRSLNDPAITSELARHFGVARESTDDKLREILRYRGMVQSSPPGDPSRGRAVFVRACVQCHVLFDAGGKVGPDLTGSNRDDLYYLLQNLLDPNAVIPNDYRTSTLETKDGRVITGIVTRRDANAVTIVTANETLVVSRADVQSLTQGEVSMMPEGLMQAFSDGEVCDLVAYLRSPTQVPLPKE